jgi:hypothetical protein
MLSIREPHIVATDAACGGAACVSVASTVYIGAERCHAKLDVNDTRILICIQ